MKPEEMLVKLSEGTLSKSDQLKLMEYCKNDPELEKKRKLIIWIKTFS